MSRINTLMCWMERQSHLRYPNTFITKIIPHHFVDRIIEQVKQLEEEHQVLCKIDQLLAGVKEKINPDIRDITFENAYLKMLMWLIILMEKLKLKWRSKKDHRKKFLNCMLRGIRVKKAIKVCVVHQLKILAKTMEKRSWCQYQMIHLKELIEGKN